MINLYNEIFPSLYYKLLIETAEKVKSSVLPLEKIKEILLIFSLIHKKGCLLFESLKTFQPESDKIKKLEILWEEFGEIIISMNISFEKHGICELFDFFSPLEKVMREIFILSNDITGEEKEYSSSFLSSSPVLNELIIISQMVVRENMGEEILKDKIKFFKEFLFTTKEQLNYLISAPDSVYLNNSSHEIMLIFHEMEEALNTMESYFEDNNKNYITEGINILCLSTKKLVKITKRLKEAFYILFHRFCFNCGWGNTTEVTVCSNCNEPLYKFTEDDFTEEISKDRELYDCAIPRGLSMDTMVLDILYEAECMYFENIDKEYFKDKVFDFEKKIDFFQNDLPFYDREKKNPFLLDEIFFKIDEAILNLREAVLLFYKYIEYNNKEYLISACRIIAETGDFLHSIMDICEDGERRFQEKYG